MYTFVKSTAMVLIVAAFSLGAGGVAGARTYQAESINSPTSVASVSRWPWVAYTYDGSVYEVRANGSGRHRVTTDVNATDPTMAPGGAFIAFLAGPQNLTNPSKWLNVRVVADEGRVSPGHIIHSTRRFLAIQSLTWSPNGRHLAFTSVHTLWVWNTARKKARVLMKGGAKRDFTSPVWSADSRDIAASFSGTQSDGSPKPHLDVVIRNVLTGKRATEKIEFPSSVTCGQVPRPCPGGMIGWLPGGSFLVSTYVTGAGNSVLSGVWSVPAAGGMARAIHNNPWAGRPLQKGPLAGATSVLLSPDRSRLLIDPANHLWIGPAMGGPGHFINVHANAGTVAEFAWEGKAHLAFITLQIVNSTMVLAKMSSVSVGTGRVIPLASITSTEKDQLALDVGPLNRPVGGAGG